MGVNFNDMGIEGLQKSINECIDDIQKALRSYEKVTNNIANSIQKEEALIKQVYALKDISESIKWAVRKAEINNTKQNEVARKPRRGEIWTCSMGKNIGSEQDKERPVLIIQNNTGNNHSPTTIVIPITSNKKNLPTHAKIDKKYLRAHDKEGINIVGVVLCEQIKSISKMRLGKKLASLNEEFMNEILEPKLRISIGLKNKSIDEIIG